MPNTYTLLEQITVGAAGASSVTFNSIPQTGYTDLVVKASTRRDVSGADNFLITFNGVTTGYTYRELTGNGSAASSSSGSLAITGLVNGATMTASTFSNNDIYIPNYTSSNFKSFTSDAVTENNLTLSYAQLWANLWSNTAAISSIKLQILGGNSFSQHSTFSLYGVAALGVTPTKAPKATGGSIIQTDGTYWYHAFLSSGTFTPATALTCDYLVVAGGGGAGSGGNNAGAGGGGAGGLRSTVTATGGGGSLETALSLSSGTGYTVTIGAGGTTATNSDGTAGNNSVFSSITSNGGGLGKKFSFTSATSGTGGSGGGGPSVASGYTSTGGSGTANQGYAGGVGTVANGFNGAGGGGAGAVGSNAISTNGGNGGAGIAISALASPTSTGVSNYYAGGGGGGGADSNIGGTGGSGGGGTGGNNAAGTNGTANTGSGGGGSGGGTNNVGGTGGSGIVIIRYLA
jgi:hypothetical protein